MNRSLYLRKIRNLRDQVDMLLQEGASLGETAQGVFETVSMGVFNNFFKSDFKAHSPELANFVKTLSDSAEKGVKNFVNTAIGYAGKTQEDMINDAKAAGKKAADATGFSGDSSDYGEDWSKMTEKQRAMAHKATSIYWQTYNAAAHKSVMNDVLTGMGNFQKFISDEVKKAYYEGYQDGKAASKSKSVRLIEGRQYGKAEEQQAYNAGYATAQAGGDEGFFTKIMNSLKSMYNKCIEYWHKFTASEDAKTLLLVFATFGTVFGFAALICMILNPEELDKRDKLLEQFYSELKDSIAKAFKQSTLKGIMAVLLAPFKILAGAIKINSQSAMGRFMMLAILFFFMGAVLGFGISGVL